ncbi:carboxymuconolactone decarboxylase family protein [Sulfurimonas sp. HSL-3221]|uniref:carboxymuconolactone decarboxylase family protein n=1 Tax=Sulfurimonadaceae TaxID=2771471 RepID=UPI001E31675B|nr:carboxymuconolactone decarboxylase family protein [Sulfurimonas sp. HSL-3221]UFS63056.1 carboxymuconolactone decarboxylase family protein [Sulfurimonas sp. HSL-3221]
MRTGMITFLFSLFSVTCSFAAEMGGPKAVEALTAKEQAMIPIAALTAAGDMERLKPALEKGLDAGLSVNEIKDILIQLYAYCGFPRSLNGINTFMEVMKVREAEGIKDTVGKAASPLPKGMDRDAYGAEIRRKLMGVTEEPPAQGYQLFTPVMDTYLKEHLFADIFARDVLDHRSRELVTISALAAMPGTEGQLRFHLGAAMNTGLSADQMAAFVAVFEANVGVRAAESVRQLLRDLLTAGDG